jgi:aldose 1-epimerase
VLEVPARTWIPTDERQVPLARTPVEGSSFDFRSAHAIGSLHLYHAFTDLERGAGGIARV